MWGLPSRGLGTGVAHSSVVGEGRGSAHTPQVVLGLPGPFPECFGEREGTWGLPSPQVHTHFLPPQKLENPTSSLLASAEEETRHSLAQREEGRGCESRKLRQDSGVAG